MKRVIGILAASGALWALPALAQDQVGGAAQPAPPAAVQPSVEGYLCTFAGKCGEQPVEEIEIDAPETRGFRLARPSAERPVAPVATRPTRSARGYVAPGRAAVRDAATPGRRRVSPATRIEAPGAVARANMAVAAAPSAAAGARRADLLIGFELNSARLNAQGRDSARVFARSLQLPELAGKRFLVEGHTDLRGGRALNLQLSERRARAVVDFLVAQGVDRSRLAAKGLGPDAPLAGRSAADPANRRVEAELVP
jgi:outer membrane protein OmpA-like peptidoglycan-associated protein